jgi:tetratricopeptide (TPR) repeat protein
MSGLVRGGLARIGLRPTLILAIALMLLWVFAYRQLSPMGWELFQPSRAGLRGLTLYLRGDYGGAGRAYRAGLVGPVWLEPEADLAGYVALRSGDLAEAVRRADATLAAPTTRELAPYQIEARVTLAEIAFERGDMGEAESQLRRTLARHPDHLDALYLSALLAARVGDMGRAIDALNRALRHGAVGDRDTLLFRLMETAGDLARRPDAERPLCLLAHLHRYLRIFDNGHAAIAMAYARQAVAAGDHPTDAYLTLGILHDKRGEHDDALQALRRAVELDPRHPEALRWAAGEARNVGDLLVEYRMIRAAFEAAPTDPFYFAPLEQVLLNRLGDAHGLTALLERTLELDPASAAAHEGLARAATALGDRERARFHLERARALRDALRLEGAS